MVKINSGERMTLMKDGNIQHQPWRSQVMNQWSKTFKHDVPLALRSVHDIVEEVLEHNLWREFGYKSPQEFFSSMGMTKIMPMLGEEGADLQEALKLMEDQLSVDESSFAGDLPKPVAISKFERNSRIKELRAKGLTFREIADIVGTNTGTVSDVVNDRYNYDGKIKGERRGQRLSLKAQTKPTVAAELIRTKFGDAYANALKSEL